MSKLHFYWEWWITHNKITNGEINVKANRGRNREIKRRKPIRTKTSIWLLLLNIETFVLSSVCSNLVLWVSSKRLKIFKMQIFSHIKSCRSSLFYNMSTRHECDTSTTRMTPVWHECYTSGASDFDNHAGENIFLLPYISHMANERLQGEEQFHSKN